MVLTKCDLVGRLDLARRVEQVRDELSNLALPATAGRLPLVMLSALDLEKGVQELRKELAALAIFKAEPAR